MAREIFGSDYTEKGKLSEYKPPIVVQSFSSGNTFFFATITIEQADNHSMLPFVTLPVVSSCSPSQRLNGFMAQLDTSSPDAIESVLLRQPLDISHFPY
jgi:hypothetical protein